MKSFFLISFTTILFLGCSSNDDDNQAKYPECFQSEINRILDSSPQSPRATIELYTYQNENVYIVNTNFPDDQSNVFNSRCELVCTIGGIDGNDNDTCVDWENAEYIETVWTDNR